MRRGILLVAFAALAAGIAWHVHYTSAKTKLEATYPVDEPNPDPAAVDLVKRFFELVAKRDGEGQCSLVADAYHNKVSERGVKNGLNALTSEQIRQTWIHGSRTLMLTDTALTVHKVERWAPGMYKFHITCCNPVMTEIYTVFENGAWKIHPALIE